MEINQQQNPTTPAEIWEILKRTSKDNEELKKQIKETARQMKETDKRIDRLSGRFDEQKRKGQVYTQVIRNCSKTEILPLISSKIGKRTTVFTDGFKTYDSLVDLGYKKHYRVRHGKNEFAKKKGRIRNHINGIENFWGLAKVRLYKFRGMDKKTFYLHLKECEFRFNHRQENLCMLLLKIIRNKPLKLS